MAPFLAGPNNNNLVRSMNMARERRCGCDKRPRWGELISAYPICRKRRGLSCFRCRSTACRTTSCLSQSGVANDLLSLILS